MAGASSITRNFTEIHLKAVRITDFGNFWQETPTSLALIGFPFGSSSNQSERVD